jgi:hypothetical protein
LGAEGSALITLGSYTFMIVAGILEIIVFFWIWNYNDRIYANKIAVGASRGLSERYQVGLCIFM